MKPAEVTSVTRSAVVRAPAALACLVTAAVSACGETVSVTSVGTREVVGGTGDQRNREEIETVRCNGDVFHRSSGGDHILLVEISDGSRLKARNIPSGRLPHRTRRAASRLFLTFPVPFLSFCTPIFRDTPLRHRNPRTVPEPPNPPPAFSRTMCPNRSDSRAPPNPQSLT